MRQMVEQFTCDRCRTETLEHATFKVHVGYVSGAVSQEYDIACIDLCTVCCGVALQRICNMAKDFEQAEAFVKAAKDDSPLKRTELP